MFSAAAVPVVPAIVLTIPLPLMNIDTDPVNYLERDPDFTRVNQDQFISAFVGVVVFLDKKNSDDNRVYIVDSCNSLDLIINNLIPNCNKDSLFFFKSSLGHLETIKFMNTILSSYSSNWGQSSSNYLITYVDNNYNSNSGLPFIEEHYVRDLYSLNDALKAVSKSNILFVIERERGGDNLRFIKHHGKTLIINDGDFSTSYL